MGIAVLGPLTVDGSGRLGPRDRIILQALASRPGASVSADELADALWGEHPPASAAKNLQSCIVRLRKALGADAIVTSEHGYRLALPPDQVDAHDFEAQVARARELMAVGASDRVAFVLDRALALWRGHAYSELGDWQPARDEAARLAELRMEAEELRVDALLRLGRPREVLATAQAMVRSAPLRERRWCLLATAQYAAGSQGEALRTLRQLRHVLAEQLGVDPGPEAEDLERAILRQDAALPGATPVSTSGQCPWLGLRSYDVDDADSFFGREADVAKCLDLLARTSFVAIVGPSGSGKSSILRAGVLAALRRRGHRLVVVTPGQHPLHALVALPADATADTVLAVDQAEEVFTLCDDPTEGHAFWDRLTSEADVRPVVLSLRADRLGDVTEHAQLRLRVERGLHLVGSLDEQGLRQIVHGPARQVGLHVEPGLVDLLVREVGDDPGALPLLSHALVETWQRREGNTLTVDGYRASGGIHGAVARSAERLYAGVEPGRRHQLRDVVLRLISPGPSGEPVRTRVARRQLASDPAHDELVEKLVAARLVTSDDGVLEITHEALARAWPRLRGWLDDDLEGQRNLHHLSAAADAWDTLGRPDSELYRGVRLAQALDWRARTASTLTDTERDFLAAARAVSQAEEESAAERARSQARLIRRLRLVLAGAVVLLVLALAAGGLAAVQSDRAQDSAARASVNETVAEARRVGAQALNTDNVEESMLLAVAGVRLDDSPETRSNLEAALARHPELVATTRVADAAISSLDVSPDGRTVATYDDEDVVRLHDLATGDLVADLQAERRQQVGARGQVRFSPDGRALAVLGTTRGQQPALLLDPTTLQPLPTVLGGLPRGRWLATDVAFSQDGHRLVLVLERVRGRGSIVYFAGTWIGVWDLAAPASPVAQPRWPGVRHGSVALSPDGRVMFTARAGGLRVHDLARGTSRWLARTRLGGMSISQQGQQLAASLQDGTGGMVLIDVTTGDQRHLPAVDGQTGWHVEFSPDGARLATLLPSQRELVAWDVASGAELARVPLGEREEALAFSSDGSKLYTAGPGGALRHWDLDGKDRFLSRVVDGRPGVRGYGSTDPAPGGALVANVTYEDVTFFDLDNRTATEHLDRGNGLGPGVAGSWDADGTHYALASGADVRVWDARSGALAVRRRDADGDLVAVDHSSDGTRLVTAELSGRVTMLDSTTLRPLGRPVELAQAACCVAAGPDNRTALVLTGRLAPGGDYVESGRSWTLVDLVSGDVLDEGELGIESDHVDFSPEGGHAAVAGRAGEVLVLDLGSGAAVGPPVVVANDSIFTVRYSPDGGRILTSGVAASVALLDGETGLLVARVLTPEAVNSAGFGDDADSVIIATSGKGPVWEWDTDVDHAVDFACRVAARDFTEAEWSALFGERPYRQTCPAP